MRATDVVGFAASGADAGQGGGIPLWLLVVIGVLGLGGTIATMTVLARPRRPRKRDQP